MSRLDKHLPKIFLVVSYFSAFFTGASVGAWLFMDVGLLDLWLPVAHFCCTVLLAVAAQRMRPK